MSNFLPLVPMALSNTDHNALCFHRVLSFLCTVQDEPLPCTQKVRFIWNAWFSSSGTLADPAVQMEDLWLFDLRPCHP